MALGGAIQFGFFLGVAVFCAACVFAPRRLLTHPRIAGTIGTANPLVARVVCLIGMGLFGALAVSPFMGMR
jgi:hypothetical protein